MFSHDIVSITDIREKTKEVVSLIQQKNYPCPVLSNNKVQFYIMSESEYEHYMKLKKLAEIDAEVQEARTTGKAYTNADDLFDDLAS